ncbi:ribonuclease H-like domain-containing protein [Tanacetum coccineum]
MRFSKIDNFKGVPHPLTRDYTPKPQEEIDDSFKNSVTSSEEVVSDPNPKEAEPSCVTHVKTPRQPMKNQGTPKVKGKNWNEMMERELGEERLSLKEQRFLILVMGWPNQYGTMQTGLIMLITLYLDQYNSILVQMLNTGSFNINTVKAKQPINTSKSNMFSPVRPQVNKFNQRSNFSKSHSPMRRPTVRNTTKMSYTHAVKGNWGTAVKTSAELGHFNLFSISQICDKQHKVLFTETECLVVSPDFKMPDENQILLKVPRQHNMYSFDMKTPAPAKDYTCLIAKATSDESKLWHRRLGHINFKNLNKLVKGNLVRGLPSKEFSEMTIHVLPAKKVSNTRPPVRLN